MPDRQYITHNHPPKLHDRIAAHLWEVIICLISIGRGAVILSDHYRGNSGWLDVHELPAGQPVIVGMFLIVGSVLWLITIVRRFTTVNRLYLMQRLAYILCWTGWTAYGLLGLVLHPTVVRLWFIPVLMSIGFVGAFGLSRRSERYIRRSVSSTKRLREEGPKT